jgi:hypothetical protein
MCTNVSDSLGSRQISRHKKKNDVNSGYWCKLFAFRFWK